MSIMRPETMFAKKFEKGFLAGERSDHAIHSALIIGLVDFIKSDKNTTGLAWAVRFMQSRNPESARFHAIVHYLREVANLRVIIDDQDPSKTNVKTVKKAEYDTVWLNGCKTTPWYKVARQMQKAKPWADPLDTMLRKYAEGLLMGDVTLGELGEVFGVKMIMTIQGMASDEKLQAKVAARMTKLDEQGELVAKAA